MKPWMMMLCGFVFLFIAAAIIEDAISVIFAFTGILTVAIGVIGFIVEEHDR